MGIKGLLKYLKDEVGCITPSIRVSTVGKRVAIDGNCLLHRYGKIYAKDIVLNEENAYYRMFRLLYAKTRFLFSQNIDEIILVFDGAKLPMKNITDESRQQKRLESKEEGMKMIRSGNISESIKHFQNSLSFSFDFVSFLVRKLNDAYNYSEAVTKGKKFEAVIAPYEADAQLAYLDKHNRVDFIISEDSDLIVYGCRKVLYKLDYASGIGQLYDYKDLFNGVMKGFNMTMFRRMCILSGCDYISNMRNVGIKTAKDIVSETRGDLNLIFKKINADESYVKRFKQAEFTFLHQYVFDILINLSVPLNPYIDYAKKLPHSQFSKTIACIERDSNIRISDFEDIDFAGKSVMTLLIKRIAYGEIHPELFTQAKDIPGVKISSSFSLGFTTTTKRTREFRPSVLSRKWLTDDTKHTQFHILKKQRLITEFFKPQ